jgi:NADH:ubiquinone oxidoreductase subunit E
LASCGTAPVILRNDEFHQAVGEKRATELVAGCK